MKKILLLTLIPFLLNAEVDFSDLAAVAKKKLAKNPEFKKVIEQLPATPPDSYFNNKKNTVLKTEPAKQIKQNVITNKNEQNRTQGKTPPMKKPSRKTQAKRTLEVQMLIDEDGNAYFPEESSNNIKDAGFSVREQVVVKNSKKKFIPKEVLRKKSNLSAGELIFLARKGKINTKYIDAFKNIAIASSVLPEKDDFIKQLNNRIFDNFVKNNSIESDSKYTIFFFGDSHFDIKMFQRFSREIKILNKMKKTFIGRILTVGLVISDAEKKEYLDKYKKIEKEKDKLDTEKDKLKISFLEKKAQKYKDYSEGTFDTNYHWVRKLYNNGVSDVKVQFHPFAFKDMGLDEVPAYLLAQCKTDFRFKTCRKIALIKGNIPLREFYKLLSEDDKKYLPEYETLLKY